MKGPVAYNLIRQYPVYRREVFCAGLEACGFRVDMGPANDRIKPDDVLVIWNRYGQNHEYARQFEAAGATVLVAENSPLGREWRDGYWYTICRNHHNVLAGFPAGGPERWESFGAQLSEWRAGGEHILYLPQRGIGVDPYREPPNWRQHVLAWLRKRTGRPVRVREHPGTAEPRPVDYGLMSDLKNAWATVTWGSGAALKALTLGVPVFHGLSGWIGSTASLPFGSDLEGPFLSDRLPCFQRLAWCMWSVEEIARGDPFRWLLPSIKSGTTPGHGLSARR